MRLLSAADALTAILEARTPPWKRPLWFWVKHLGAWPSSPEVVASAFDYDRAPFFQSFMEVRVEGSTNTVRFWLYGANGRLRWRDLHVQDGMIPNGQSANDHVEFSFPLRPRVAKLAIWAAHRSSAATYAVVVIGSCTEEFFPILVH